MVNTKEQKRSAFALQKIKEVYNCSIDDNTVNFIVGVPTMILENGFGQTLSFLAAKKKKSNDSRDKHAFIFSAVGEWVGLGTETFAILSAISALSQREYIDKQEEALKLLQWFKRYAKAFESGGK